MAIEWTPLRRLIEGNSRFVITSHVRPDADAIGSEIGLAGLLEQLGKTAVVINTSAMPPHLRFLDPNGHVRQLGVGATTADVQSADVQLIVDTSSWAQLSDVGKAMRDSKAPRAVIDHHVSADDLGALEFKDTLRESTGSLIFELYQQFKLRPTPSAATAMFAAVATDTGWFRFPATTGETLRVGGALIDCGAESSAVYRELYEQGTLARVRLRGLGLSRVEMDCEGRLAYTYMALADFEQFGALPSDTEDLVNECLTIAGTEAAFIAIEQANRQVKISFRSRSRLNVAAIAEQFGGGGHKQAAGATLPGPLKTAIQTALAAIRVGLAALPDRALPVPANG